MWMGPYSATHYRVDDFNVQAAEKLLAYLTGQASYQAPPQRPEPEARPRIGDKLWSETPRVVQEAIVDSRRIVEHLHWRATVR